MKKIVIDILFEERHRVTMVSLFNEIFKKTFFIS